MKVRQELRKRKEGVQLLRPLLKAHWALELRNCTSGTCLVSEACCITHNFFSQNQDSNH